VDDGTRADSKRGPGRFRGAGLVALNPVIQPSSTRRRRGNDGGDWSRGRGRFRAINRIGFGADDDLT
jgi:hypothetical protein